MKLSLAFILLLVVFDSIVLPVVARRQKGKGVAAVKAVVAVSKLAKKTPVQEAPVAKGAFFGGNRAAKGAETSRSSVVVASAETAPTSSLPSVTEVDEHLTVMDELRDRMVEKFKYCYRDSYLRGSRMADCPTGKVNDGATCRDKGRLSGITGMSAMTCKDSESITGARCYPLCREGFSGALDFCWMTCPSGWTNCGASCSKEGTSGCVIKVGKTILSGLLVAGSVASMILSAGTLTPALMAANAARFAESLKKAQEILETLNKIREWYERFSVTVESLKTLRETVDDRKLQRIIKYISLISTANILVSGLTLLDPTGIAGLAKELTAPKCNELEKNWLVFSVIGAGQKKKKKLRRKL